MHHPGLLQASLPCPMRETGNLEGSRSLEQRPCGWSHLAGRAHGGLVAEPGPRPGGQSVHGSPTAGEWQCDLLCPHEPQQRRSAPPLIPARICPVHSGACHPHTQGWAGYLSSAPLCSAPWSTCTLWPDLGPDHEISQEGHGGQRKVTRPFSISLPVGHPRPVLRPKDIGPGKC